MWHLRRLLTHTAGDMSSITRRGKSWRARVFLREDADGKEKSMDRSFDTKASVEHWVRENGSAMRRGTLHLSLAPHGQRVRGSLALSASQDTTGLDLARAVHAEATDTRAPGDRREVSDLDHARDDRPAEREARAEMHLGSHDPIHARHPRFDVRSAVRGWLIAINPSPTRLALPSTAKRPT